MFTFLADIQSQTGFHATYEFYEDNNEIARDIHIVDDGLLVIGIGTKELEYYTYILKLNFDGDTLWSEKHFDVYGITDKTFIKDSWLYVPGFQLLTNDTYEIDGFRLYKFNLEGKLKDSKKYNLDELSDAPVDEILSYLPMGTIAWKDKIVVYGVIYEANFGISTEVFGRGLMVYYNEDLSYDIMVIVQPRYEQVQIFDAHIDSDSLLTILVDDDTKDEGSEQRFFRGFQKYDSEGHKIWASEPFELVQRYLVVVSFSILSNKDLVTYYFDDRGVVSSYILVSHNASGEINWKLQLDPIVNMDRRIIVDVEEAVDGNILVSGLYYDNPMERQGAYLAKHDRDTGKLIWERVYQDWSDREFQIFGLSKNIQIMSMKSDEQGRVYMTGNHTRFTESNSDDRNIAVIGVDESGCLDSFCGGFEQTVAGTPKYNQLLYQLSIWYEQNPEAQEGFYHTWYVNGSNIPGDTVRQLARRDHNLGQFEFAGGEVGGQFFQMKNGGRQVYLKKNDDYVLLYDFTLDVGDIFQSDYTPYDLEVIESDSILLLNGAKRRTWTLSCTENPENTLTWIEGIGTNYGMLWPADFCSGNYGDTRLSCYYVYERLHYMNPEYDECLTPLSSTDNLAFKQLSAIEAYPNPTQYHLTISAPDDLHITRTELLDPQGRTHTRFHEHSSEVRLDLSGYPAGLYFVSIHTEKGSVVKKVVVE